MKKVSRNLKDTEKLAQDILGEICAKKSKNACVIGLYGDLGAGKTAFTQALSKHLGVKEKVVSPTFVIMKKFPIEGSKFKTLIHIDAYRLAKSEELSKLGWADIISDKNNLVLVEWPQLVADIIPDDHFKIKIKHLDENTREFDICP